MQTISVINPIGICRVRESQKYTSSEWELFLKMRNTIFKALFLRSQRYNEPKISPAPEGGELHIPALYLVPAHVSQITTVN